MDNINVELTPEEDAEVLDLSLMASELLLSESSTNDMEIKAKIMDNNVELTPEEDADVLDLSLKATELVLSESATNDMDFELYAENHFDEIVAFGYQWFDLFYPIFYDGSTGRKRSKFVIRHKRFMEIFQTHWDKLLVNLRDKKIKRMPRFEYNRNEKWVHFHSALWAEESISSGISFWPEDSIGMPDNVERPEVRRLERRTPKPKYLKDSSGMSAHHVISLKLLTYFQNTLEMCRNSQRCPITDRLLYLRERNCRKLHLAKFWCCPNEDFQFNEPSICRCNAPQKLPAKFVDYASSSNLLDRRDEMACWSPYGSVIMMGPGNRGPFDPAFRELEFEIDSRPILGDERYYTFYWLYEKMLKFKNKWENSSTVSNEMCREADELELQRFLAYTRYPNKVPYNPEHWGERSVHVNDRILREEAKRQKKKMQQLNRHIIKKTLFSFIRGTQDLPMDRGTWCENGKK